LAIFTQEAVLKDHGIKQVILTGIVTLTRTDLIGL